MKKEPSTADEAFNRAAFETFPTEQHDPVNHPSHYTEGEIECIDALESALGVEGFRGYCIGTSIAYLWRYRSKGGLEDLEKSEWYVKRAEQHMRKHRDD